MRNELQRHFSVIESQNWPEIEKVSLRNDIARFFEEDGRIDYKTLSPSYRWNLCVERLKDGLFDNWDGFQFRSDWAVTFFGMNGYGMKVPKWDGSPVGKLIVLGEQGLGDEILFFSALPELIVRLGHEPIRVQCYPVLKKLVERSFRVEVTDRQSLGNVSGGDAVMALADLFPFYRRRPEHFPRKPYMKADPELVDKWKDWLSSYGDKPKIGLAWYTRKGFVDPADLMTKDAVYFDLQYRDDKKTIQEPTEAVIKPPFDTKNDFDNLFAFVAALDSVHTVAQTLVHVAGSQAIDCKVVLPPKNGEVKQELWYYGNGEEVWDSPVYGNMKVFRNIETFKALS